MVEATGGYLKPDGPIEVVFKAAEFVISADTVQQLRRLGLEGLGWEHNA